MEEPKLSFADLRKRFEQGNKAQPQPATTKPVVQPAPTTGKSVNTVQPPVTASKQPVKEVTAPSTVNTKPAETAPANSIPSTIQKPKVEPETTTKPALPLENPKPSSSLSQNPFIARNNAQQKSSATISETSKPSDNSTATRTQASHEVKPVQEEAKSSPFGNIKQQTSPTTTPASTTHTQSSEQETESPKPSVTSEVSKPVSTSTTSQNPAPAEAESTSKPSNIFATSNTHAPSEIKKTQEEVKPSPFGPTKTAATTSSSPTKSNQPEENSSSPSKSFGASPFGASNQTVTSTPSTTTTTTATQAVSSTKTTTEPEKILNKPSVVVNSKPGEFKPIPKEQGKVDEGAPVANKMTSPDTAGEPKMSIKDRMKMFEKAKSDDSGLKPLPKTTTTTSTTVKTAGLPNKAAQEITSPSPTVTQTTAVSQPKPVGTTKEEPIIVNKPVVKESEVVSKPVVGSVKQNIFNKEETKKEEAPAPVTHKKSVDRKDSSEKPVPITHATTAPVHSITKKNADFASNLNALLGGKVSTAEPIKVVKPKDEGASSQDAYTEALLAKPTTVSTKKKATLVFMDDDEDF